MWLAPLRPTDPRGAVVPVHRPQFRCLIHLPGTLMPQDGIVDTGAPLTHIPERIWSGLAPGTDFEWLDLGAGAPAPGGVIAGWRYTFRLARFLAPVTLMDSAVAVDRADVIAAFASGNPTGARSVPPLVIGLWGGLLEGAAVRVTRDPASGSVFGALELP